ncbi:hypothetical protein KCV03_g185, partial [Aureobasidium melanogenum]
MVDERVPFVACFQSKWRAAIVVSTYSDRTLRITITIGRFGSPSTLVSSPPLGIHTDSYLPFEVDMDHPELPLLI